MAAFYGEYGVGKFGLNKAFRIIEKEEEHKVIIDPIINVEHIYFKDIVGYEMQKKKLIENTSAEKKQIMSCSLEMREPENLPA